MFRIERLLTWGGVCSCTIGAIFGLIAMIKGGHARQLQSIKQVGNLSELKQILGLVPIIIAVTGRVFAEKKIKCELSQQHGVIIELVEDRKSETRSASNIWIPGNDRLRHVVRETDWALLIDNNDSSKPQRQLPIINGRTAAGDYMQMSGEVFIPSQEGLLEHVLGHIAGHKSLGIRQCESLLPDGTALTAIGELTTAVDHPSAFKNALKPSDGPSTMMYVLKAPRKGPFILSRQRLTDVISSTQATSRACTEIAGWFTAIGASMLLVVVSRRAYVKYREHKLRQRAEEARARRELSGNSDIKSTNDDTTLPRNALGRDTSDNNSLMQRGMCVVCFERNSGLIYPCGHLCVCEQCVQSSASISKCPICRARGPPIKVYTT